MNSLTNNKTEENTVTPKLATTSDIKAFLDDLLWDIESSGNVEITARGLISLFEIIADSSSKESKTALVEELQLHLYGYTKDHNAGAHAFFAALTQSSEANVLS